MGLLSKNSGMGSPDFSGFSGGGMQQGIKATDSLIKTGERGYDRHRQQMARDAIGKAWASGDPAQLDAAMGAYPEYIKQMQKQMGIRDDMHRKDLGSMSYKLHSLLSAGDTEGAKALVQQNAHLFDKEGPYSAQGVAGMIDSGDDKTLQHLDNWAQATTIGALTPLEIAKEGDAQQRFKLDEQRSRWNHEDRMRGQDLNNQFRWANLGERKNWHNEMSGFHDRMLKLRENAQGGGGMTDINGNDLSPYDYNRLLLSTGHDPSTGKRATGPQFSNSQKWMQGNQAFTSAQETLHQQLGKINELLAGNNLEHGTGRWQGWVPGALMSDEGQKNRDLIDSIRSGEFTTNVQKLRGMGALSNSEGAKLMDLTAKVDPTQDVDVLRGQLQAVQDQYQRLIDANYQDAADMGYGQSVLQAYQGKEGGGSGKSGSTPPQKSSKPEGSKVTGKNGKTYVTHNGYWVPEGGA